MTAPPPLGITAKVRVVEVIDGDTIELELVRRIRCRLRDCWSPELRGGTEATKRKGRQAKEHLAAIAQGKSGILHVPTDAAHRIGDVMTFDRVLGDVWLDGQTDTLSERQVAAGHATALKGEAYDG